MTFPAGCAWTSDDASTPFINMTGSIGVRQAAAATCQPGTGSMTPMSCSIRLAGGGQALAYGISVVPGRSYQVGCVGL